MLRTPIIARILLSFYRQRKEISETQIYASSSMNQMDYSRVMLLGCIDTIISLPLTTISLLLTTLQQKGGFWPERSGTQALFYDVPQVPSCVWRSSGLTRFSILWPQWAYVLLSAIFFALLGINRNMGFWSLTRCCGNKRRDLSEINFAPGSGSINVEMGYGTRETSLAR